ncbi:MAG: hypothetical protein H6704_23465 [Myxococcales bacterium]|nr:hypothetical protein [Myxococcales bacterium]
MRLLLPWTLLLAACGGPSRGPSCRLLDHLGDPPPPDPCSPAVVAASDDPAAVVCAWFAAAAARDADAAYALGTPSWAAEARRWPRGFSHRVFVDGDVIAADTVHPPTINGDAASVWVRATLLHPDLWIGGERLRFTLTRTPAGWRISDLR